MAPGAAGTFPPAMAARLRGDGGNWLPNATDCLSGLHTPLTMAPSAVRVSSWCDSCSREGTARGGGPLCLPATQQQ